MEYSAPCIDIELKLKRIEEDPEGVGTTQLYKCIQGVSTLAGRAFEPLFERQVNIIIFLKFILLIFSVERHRFQLVLDVIGSSRED